MGDLQGFLNQASYWAVSHQAIEGNSYHKDICSTASIGTSTAWCAGFVYACAKKSGNTKLIGRGNATAPSVCHTVVSKGGSWIKGPSVTGSKVTPKVGDLILFTGKKPMVYTDSGKVAKGGWHGSHIGIVYKVTSTYAYTYEGNVSGNKAKPLKRKLSSKSIAGYARPKWGPGDGPLYTTKNDRHDMTMREVGYMNSNGKLTTSDTGVKIAIINYTTLLGDLYDMFARNKYGQKIVNTSKLKGNEKIVVDYLLADGFNAAAACGIAANIKTDSNYNPATLSGSSYGICKWSGVTAGMMRIYAGATNWATNLTGQLDFLMADIQENFEEMVNDLYAVDVSSSGAAKAASIFAKEYMGISKTTTRETVAKSIYGNIVTTKPVTVGTTKPSTPKSDTAKVINISKLKQKALSICWTYFDVGRCDTDIRNEWIKKGSGVNKGLTYMDGCYLVSTHSSLACKVNDYLEIALNGAGTLKCIVAGLHNDNTLPIQIYRPRSSNINLKDWATTTIKQIKDFGTRKGV
jgi:hypothetical protein